MNLLGNSGVVSFIVSTLISVLISVLCLSSALVPASAGAATSAATSAVKRASPVASMPSVDGFSYLFVGGFGNELGQDHYFKNNVAALKQQGAQHVEIYFPSSFNSVEANVEGLREKILELHKRSGRPVIVLGHSKGGVESLATVLTHPELIVENTVYRVVLIQSPVGGNALFDQRGRWANTLVRLLSFFYRSTAGLASLQTSEIERVIKSRVGELKSGAKASTAFQKVDRAVFYVTSEKDPAESARIFQLQARLPKVLFPGHVPNDGLVARSDMSIDGFGRTLSSYYADHLETVLGRNVRGLVDNNDAETVRAFTLEVVAELLVAPEAAAPICSALFQ